MSNRLIPYGYHIQNGKLMIDEKEEVYVKEIYEKRASGETLKQITDSLNLRNIPFYRDAMWDKHKVKRILENERYIGKDEYPPILTEADVIKAEKFKMHIESTCHPSVHKLKNIIKCGNCGHKLLRLHDKRRKNATAWKCEKCGLRVLFTDNNLLKDIQESNKKIKERLSNNPMDSLSRIPESPEARLLENKISRLLGSMDRDNDEIRHLIMQWTAQRYEDSKDTEQDHTERLRLLLDEHVLDIYDDELTAKIVNSIILNESCIVTVRYINGMEITMGKEKNHGDTC